MGHTAEIRLAHPDQVLGHTLEVLPSVTFRPAHRVHELTDDRQLYVSVHPDSGTDWDTIEAAFETDDTVASARHVVEGDRVSVCEFSISHDAVVGFAPQYFDVGIHVTAVWNEGAAWAARIQAASREAIRAYVEACTTSGIDVTVAHVFANADEGTSPVTPRAALTDAQWEALEVAQSLGYFAVPRESTLADVGTTLDISPSAAGRRIRRGMDRLVTRVGTASHERQN